MLRLLDLPRDLLLHLLLHHFTVQEVIQFRSLCHELFDLVHYCLDRRRSLKLFISFFEVQVYSRVLYEHNLESDPVLRLHPRGPSSDELILRQQQFLNPRVVGLLVDGLFPNVTHLIIFFRDVIRIGFVEEYVQNIRTIRDNLAHLISRMSPRLTGLSLLGKIRGDFNGNVLARRLLHLINQYRNLRRLDLCVDNWHLCNDNYYFPNKDGNEIVPQQLGQTFLCLEPKLLNKLERISVLFDYVSKGSHFCKHSFRHLGPHLTHLVMHQKFVTGNFNVPESLLCHCLIGRTSSLSTSSITHLKLTQHLSSLLSKVLPRFTRLKSLDLENSTISKTESGMSLLELFGLLAQFCPQLTELKLSKFTLGWVREAEKHDLPQLENIKHLVLKCGQTQRYFDLEAKPVDKNIPFEQFLHVFGCILPNLERLYIKNEPGWFHYNLTVDPVEILSIIPRLRMLSIGSYSGFYFTAHHLLSAQYRKRYIRECGERWTELEKQYDLYCKDLDGVWRKEKF